MTGAIVSIILLIYATVHESGFEWMTTWWLWLFILPWPFLFFFIGKEQKVSAGADWLAVSTRDYVKLYDLSKVTVHIDGVSHAIQLADTSGRSVRSRIGVLQLNHRLWDLVYNGILHSVHVNGAETNKRAREYLQLDHPPHLHNQ
ncbi:hypothetical protein JD82_03419 [Prauserella rugosa]|uniref:Uncharacterized protein n=2 Tax=Prauserella rugosa TaxID=43354 RepID=A0A660CGK7_9PSEU|nr:hypothetical protein JD82_03419 [Prauserella rugosa]